MLRFCIAEELRDAGFVVLEAKSADQAAAVFKTGAGVDLIFSDVHMPGSMTGLDFARYVRAGRPELPIILTSATAIEPDQINGVAQFLAKPYDLNHMVMLIRATLAAPRSGDVCGPVKLGTG